MRLNVTISIDDVHPQKGWRILGDQTEKWLRSLNEEFGAKFTLFCPSNYHRQYPLSEHKEWIRELASIEWIELAAHGHYHQTSDPRRFGECEFAEIVDIDDARKRLDICYEEWLLAVGKFPDGWRNPGWLCSSQSNRAMSYLPLKYVAVHYEHNHNLPWNCKTFFGHDGIQQENISIHNGNMVMFTSHIAGSWNHNVWNETNVDQLRLSLEHLVNEYDCEFKTLKECL